MKKFLLATSFVAVLNSFALDNPKTDFMQNSFKVSLSWLENKPKSSAKDFFILQYLENENLSYADAKKAYDMRNGRSSILDRAFNSKFNSKLSPEDRFCYNATLNELKTSSSKCIALGLSSLKKVSDLSKSDLDFFTSKLDPYPTQKKDFINIKNANISSILNSDLNYYLKLFFAVSDNYRYKNFNKNLSFEELNKISSHKDFEKFLRYIVFDKNLKNLQKSLFSLKANKSLSAYIEFLLGINAVNNEDFVSAKEFFEASLNNSYLRSDKDKALFWLYLLSEDKNYLYELSQSFDINIYTLYAKELLNLPVDNIIYNIEQKNTHSSYDIYDVFKWDTVTSDTKKNLDDEKMSKYYNIFTSKDTEPHLAFVLERFHKYKNQYYITPYREILNAYDINKQVLIYSIARQESRFIPSSVSFASAQGMMQIMPFLSKDIAAKLKEPYNIYNQFNPRKNIQYASFHLDSLNKQFDNNPLFVAYAYNGGAGYTRTQLKKGLFKDKNRFEPFLSMEMISFTETREYGKKVLTNYYIYNNYLNKENKISLSTILQNLVSPY